MRSVLQHAAPILLPQGWDVCVEPIPIGDGPTGIGVAFGSACIAVRRRPVEGTSPDWSCLRRSTDVEAGESGE
jgi:hypothetical protein